MNNFEKILIVIAAVSAAVVGLTMISALNVSPPPSVTPTISVAFVGIVDNPTAVRSGPGRTILCQGATGKCAIFRVANPLADNMVYFDTIAVEREVDGKWRAFTPVGTSWMSVDGKWRGGLPVDASWMGVGGGRWGPGSSCLYAVAWPPGLPEDARWRLRLACGLDLYEKRWLPPLEMMQKFRLTELTWTQGPATNEVTSSVVDVVSTEPNKKLTETENDASAP